MRTDDLRFHITSLVAVFLALGIGILIGTAFVGAPLVERQVKTLRTLSTSVTDLGRRTETTEKNEEALRALLPVLVANRLARRRVLVVQTGDYADAAERAGEALRLAGAEVTRVALPREPWRARLAARHEQAEPKGLLPPVTFEAEELAGLLAGPRASGDATDDTTARRLRTLRDDGLLTGDVLGSAPGFRWVVLVGGAAALPSARGSGGRADKDTSADSRVALDLSLIKAWLALGVSVAGAEPLVADVSYVRDYQSAGIASVDNIDRAAGQIALPFALLGEKAAAYGMKRTAERVLPEFLSQPLPVLPPAAPAPPPDGVPETP